MGSLKYKIEIQFPTMVIAVTVFGIVLSISVLTSDTFNTESMFILANDVIVPLMTILLLYLSIKSLIQWRQREVIEIYEQGIVVGNFKSNFDQVKIIKDSTKGSYTFSSGDQIKIVQGNFKKEDQRILDELIS